MVWNLTMLIRYQSWMAFCLVGSPDWELHFRFNSVIFKGTSISGNCITYQSQKSIKHVLLAVVQRSSQHQFGPIQPAFLVKPCSNLEHVHWNTWKILTRKVVSFAPSVWSSISLVHPSVLLMSITAMTSSMRNVSTWKVTMSNPKEPLLALMKWWCYSWLLSNSKADVVLQSEHLFQTFWSPTLGPLILF